VTQVDLTPQDDRPSVDYSEASPAADPLGVSDGFEIPDVSEDQIRSILSLIGAGAHITVGHPAIDDHWRFTDSELDQLAPPVTSWVNRSARLKSAAQHGDAVTIAVALGLYTSRNLKISSEVAAAEADEAAIADEVPLPDDGDAAGLQPWTDVP